jgi:DNA-binding HxlR family transcriptional regulator
MKGYGQFCPVAKAAEIVCERWTPLIVRELICGSRRFSEIQRGVPLMSPSLLSQRLLMLERAGIVEHHGDNRRSSTYELTPAGSELRPLIEGLGVWGQRWVRGQLHEDDLDPGLLMWDIQRRIDMDAFPSCRTCVQFDFAGARVWIGDLALTRAIQNAGIELYGPAHLRKAFPRWLRLGVFAGVKPAVRPRQRRGART